jgi:hypothetical protein
VLEAPWPAGALRAAPAVAIALAPAPSATQLAASASSFARLLMKRIF